MVLTILSGIVIASQGPCELRGLNVSMQAGKKTKSIQSIRYCDLVHAPDKYSGRKIQTSAILVAVIAPTADGTTILYSPECDGKKNRVVVADDKMLLIPENEAKKLERAFRNQNTDRKIGRVEIIVTGKFNFPMNNTIYKHLPGLEIISVDKITQVKDDVPWPSGT